MWLTTVRCDDSAPSTAQQPQQASVHPDLTHVTRADPLARGQPHSLIHSAVPKETAIATHAALHGLSPEKERELRELYDRLDMDNDGTIDIRDLTAALTHEIPHIPERYAPSLMRRLSPKAKLDDRVEFHDFARYIVEHERNLEAMFHQLDRNKDGHVDMGELKWYCEAMGAPLSDTHAQVLLAQMDTSGSCSSVNLGEFQQFMLLYPSHDPKDIVSFWKHNLVIDIGEDSQVPEDFSPQEMQSGVWWRHLVAGAVAGCMSRTCTAPLDRIKVYLQVHATKQNGLVLSSAVRLLYSEGGIKSFWRGNGVNVIKIAPESAIKFMAYEQCKRMIQKAKGSSELTIYERLAAGSSAGAISQTIIYPMEVLKTRLALRKTGQLDAGFIHFAGKMYKKEGFKCFYKGYVPNLLGIIPYAGIDLAVYETLKTWYVSRHADVTEPGVLALLACGTCSSTCGQLTSYPLALVRTRLQARSVSADPSQPDTMFGQFKYILKNEGPAGLYRGITPNFMKVIPAVSISYVVYEKMRKHLGATMS